MHEVGLVQEMLSAVEASAEGASVLRIVVQIGAVSGVMPDAFRFAFEACRAGTLASAAELEIRHIPARGRCRACGREKRLSHPLDLCDCGEMAWNWISGTELKLVEMETTLCVQPAAAQTTNPDR